MFMKSTARKISKEVETILKPYNEDIKRHMSVLSEDLQGRLTGALEIVMPKFEQIDHLTHSVDGLRDDIQIIKNNVEFIKDSLKKKVDYEEFIALEKRVSRMEAKVGR